jgi:hypothetical protein
MLVDLPCTTQHTIIITINKIPNNTAKHMAAISPAVRPADTTVSIICGAAMINKYIYCKLYFFHTYSTLLLLIWIKSD